MEGPTFAVGSKLIRFRDNAMRAANHDFPASKNKHLNGASKDTMFRPT